MIKAADLCQYALDAVGGGYVWGADGQKCSPSVRQELANRVQGSNPQQYSNILGLCAKWDGRNIWDCSGLFRGAWRKLLAYKSGGATGIYNTWCGEKGTIDTMPDIAGIALFRAGSSGMSHIGLYVGNGMVADARGSSYGVLHSALSSYAWTHWGRLSDVDYEGIGKPVPAPNILYQAEVVNVKTGLNLRTGPDMGSSTMKLLARGTVVDVLEVLMNGFSRITYQGRTGYVTTSYLKRLEDTQANGGYVVTLQTYQGNPLSQEQAFNIADEYRALGYGVEVRATVGVG